ncbi:acyl-CoA thioesterase II [uncultured Pseudacidovorax sp.]|uniref:acyl-CoA thioesterase n=1 Tax=uncultured Pseudacidovorax sp. TaxID=679313 RepID=UPI0025E28C25|nr:acyl-CoA thioesterase domain-containing protein [uncultured Pseudacidovorax sp.]
MSATVPVPDLADRLQLRAAGPGRWRNLHGDANQNGRAYGGQLLGQAMHALLMEMPAGRAPTMMQFLFLQGAMPAQPIVFEVARLQEGKRFSACHVRGTQGERTVLDAHATCAAAMEGPSHRLDSAAPPGEQPAILPTLEDIPAATREALARMGGYGRGCDAAIDSRIPEMERQLDPQRAGPQLRYWLKAPQPLGDDPAVQIAAFAYLSDWWLNACMLLPHLGEAGERAMYISSLNHALWLHAPLRADDWLHVQTACVHSAGGRGLAVAQYHDADGRHVATATQDCLMAFAGR